ncbi:MAG: type II toxin-antitoxin system VapC family toxin [Actinobacteria bacterium]|nr:type II toxin-antitoxin system VapC family toxin [Actinomycetota bacterium]
MVLVDTSVWVAHLHQGNTGLETLLNDSNVVCHPFIIGELACGNIKNRSEILSLLKALPRVTQARHDEVMQFIENYRLMGLGLGYIDMHLLASTLLTQVPIWTFDKKLNEVALKLRLAL